MYATLKRCLPPRPSVSGREAEIRSVIETEMSRLCDSTETDALGNLICLRRGCAKQPRKVLLMTHMDEAGFIVTSVEENGVLRIAPVGKVNEFAAAYAPVVFENGKRGILVPEEAPAAGKALRFEKCYVDIGAQNRRAAEKNISVGDCCAFVPGITRLSGTRVCGGPFGGRIGCAVLLKIAAQLPRPQDDVYYVFSVQSEVGSRGAGPAAFRIAPDFALIYDVTLAKDVSADKQGSVRLGDGVAVKFKDRSVICDLALASELSATASEKGIRAQREVFTHFENDSFAVQAAGCGCRVGALSVPCRNIRTGSELLDLSDAEAAAELTLSYLKRGEV